MIVRPGQNWFRLLFVWNGSVLQSIIPQLVFMAIVSSLAGCSATTAIRSSARRNESSVPAKAIPQSVCR
jgi:predicted membrane chloride channel (bestrophin family)